MLTERQQKSFNQQTRFYDSLYKHELERNIARLTETIAENDPERDIEILKMELSYCMTILPNAKIWVDKPFTTAEIKEIKKSVRDYKRQQRERRLLEKYF